MKLEMPLWLNLVGFLKNSLFIFFEKFFLIPPKAEIIQHISITKAKTM